MLRLVKEFTIGAILMTGTILIVLLLSTQWVYAMQHDLSNTWCAKHIPKRANIDRYHYYRWIWNCHARKGTKPRWGLPPCPDCQKNNLANFSPLFPPAEFDHPYDGEVYEMIVSDEVAKFLCNDHLACALKESKGGGTSCLIVLSPYGENKLVGITLENLRTHEIAHCNGWPADHPGAKTYVQGIPWEESSWMKGLTWITRNK